MYAAFETLTEPHQLFATLQCVAVVGRPLLGDVQGFPEGKSHLFPLLTLTLPGIDPNDYKKTLVWICHHYPLCRSCNNSIIHSSCCGCTYVFSPSCSVSLFYVP